MPSDTAALAFALATVAWGSSRRCGVAAASWAAVMTCLPRLYFGYHYLSDLLVGAALGALSVAVALRAPLPAGMAVPLSTWLRRLDARAPALLVLAFFALGAECLHAFRSTRKMAAAAGDVVAAIAAKPGESAGAPAEKPSAVGGKAARAAPTTPALATAD